MPKNSATFRLADPDAPLAATVDTLIRREPMSRRRWLQGLAATAVFAAPPLKALAACSLIPAETAGPYPGDGTNGPNVLTQSGIVRSDIRASFGASGTTVAAGTLLTVTLQLVNVNDNCAPLAGHAVYLWHCDAVGRYSMYSSGATTQNYLRGVQVSDAEGKVTFTTIFPGAYSGRWPHIHFEVYENLVAAVSGRNALRTSQLALPEDVCRTVYAQAAAYPGSLANMNTTTLANDNVFSNDSAVLQLAATTGSLGAGYASALTVGVASTAAATPPDINQAGLTGMWFEAASSGQGLALEVYPDMNGSGRAFMQGGWFTYDVAPAGGVEKQRWYTFTGEVGSGTAGATLPLYLNTGGNFDAPPVTSAARVGTVRIAFESCTAGSFTYTFDDGRTGAVPITRLTPNVACSTTSARPTSRDFALSGNWYDPSTSGQGFIVEVNPNVPVVFFCWYTYAAAGQALGANGQRWFTGQAPYTVGSSTMPVVLYETRGGVFDSDTATTQSSVVAGNATLRFTSCTDATLAYAFTGGSNAGRSGTIALKRLGPTPTGCSV